MSQHGFDEVSQGLGTSVWRRRGVKLLAAIALGGVVSLFGTSGAHGARCKLVGQRCRQSSECCGGFCDPATGKCACPNGSNLCPATKRCIACKPGASFNATTCECFCPAGTQECTSACCNSSVGQICCGVDCCGPDQICANGICLGATTTTTAPALTTTTTTLSPRSTTTTAPTARFCHATCPVGGPICIDEGTPDSCPVVCTDDCISSCGTGSELICSTAVCTTASCD